jgi:hypothetical protein
LLVLAGGVEVNSIKIRGGSPDDGGEGSVGNDGSSKDDDVGTGSAEAGLGEVTPTWLLLEARVKENVACRYV